MTVNEAPNALDGRQWHKIPHLWFFNDVAGLHIVENDWGAQLVIGGPGALGTIGGARATPKWYKVPPLPLRPKI